MLPVAQYPRITPPGVSISIRLPRCRCPEVADSVNALHQRRVNGIEGHAVCPRSRATTEATTRRSRSTWVPTSTPRLVMVQNRVTLACATPQCGAESGHHDPEADAGHAHDRQLHLAGRPLRRQVPPATSPRSTSRTNCFAWMAFRTSMCGASALQHESLARSAETRGGT